MRRTFAFLAMPCLALAAVVLTLMPLSAAAQNQLSPPTESVFLVDHGFDPTGLLVAVGSVVVGYLVIDLLTDGGLTHALFGRGAGALIGRAPCRWLIEASPGLRAVLT